MLRPKVTYLRPLTRRDTCDLLRDFFFSWADEVGQVCQLLKSGHSSNTDLCARMLNESLLFSLGIGTAICYEVVSKPLGTLGKPLKSSPLLVAALFRRSLRRLCYVSLTEVTFVYRSSHVSSMIEYWRRQKVRKAKEWLKWRT